VGAYDPQGFVNFVIIYPDHQCAGAAAQESSCGRYLSNPETGFDQGIGYRIFVNVSDYCDN
jgi:hypothetical protein